MPKRREAFEVRYRPVYGGQDALEENLRTPPGPALRVNRLRCDEPKVLLDDLRGRGIVDEPVPWWPHAAFRDPVRGRGQPPRAHAGPRLRHGRRQPPPGALPP